MGQELIVSVSGLRGIVGANLTPVTAVTYGAAFGTFLRERHADTETVRVCIGRDSRPSGPMIAAAVGAGLAAAGVEVVDLGLVTTPTVGIMVRELHCAGGVIVTASHNPLPYNGIKLLLDNGMAPPLDTAAEIRTRFQAGRVAWTDSPSCGPITTETRSDRIHLDRVLALVDSEGICARAYRVVLDSVNGAGGGIGTALLEALGCTVVGVNTEPTGLFAHEPEPTAANLGSLGEAVMRHGADLGFAQDPDADRLAIVDQTGTYLGEEYTLALAASGVLRAGTSAAANLSTSRMIDDVAARVGATVVRTPVGEAHVAGAMIERGCAIGGEGNGGVIDLRVGPIRDSLVAMAHVLDLMARTGRPVADLARELGTYAMIKEKFPADAALAQRLLAAAQEHFPGARVDTRDGVRCDFEAGWIHLRTSNTEPVMRAIAEAPDEAAARGYVDAILALRDQIRG